MRLGCVIMAAGRGERFGSNKLLATLGGQPLLWHVLQAVPKERFQRILVVVSGPETARLCKKAGVPYRLYDGGPQSETVRQGISQMMGLEGCLFVLGDQPLCTRQSINRLLATFAQQPQTVCRLAFGGELGSPVIFPAALFPKLMKLEGDRGGMAAAKGYPVLLVQADAPQELWDADTPEMLAQLEIYLKNRSLKGE